MNNQLATYLRSTDERLLFYLDEDDEMMLDTVERLRNYTSALLAGSIAPAFLVKKWSDWYSLAPAFVLVYGTVELATLQQGALFLQAVEGHDVVGLTDADRAYLQALEMRLDEYPAIRKAGE